MSKKKSIQKKHGTHINKYAKFSQAEEWLAEQQRKEKGGDRGLNREIDLTNELNYKEYKGLYFLVSEEKGIGFNQEHIPAVYEQIYREIEDLRQRNENEKILLVFYKGKSIKVKINSRGYISR